MAGAFVQVASNAGQNTATPSVTINGVAAGATLVLFITDNSGNRTVTSISDGTNTWTLLYAQQTTSFSTGAVPYYAYNVPAGNYTITVTMSASTSNYTLSVTELSGQTTTDPKDQTIGGTTGAGAGTTFTVTTGATTQATETLVALCHMQIAGRPFNAISGWTNRLNLSTASSYHGVWTKNVSATGAQSVTFSSAPDNQRFLGFLATFFDAASGQGALLSHARFSAVQVFT